MDRIVLDTYELEMEIIAILEREKHLVLATCSDGRVTARTMSHVNAGLIVFFQTDKQFLKVEQMLKNTSVALCTGNLQIEGPAELNGHPSEHRNSEFCNLYKKKHPHSFEKYTGMKNEIVVKVKPSLFTLWKYIDGKPCRDYLNVLEMRAYREFYKL